MNEFSAGRKAVSFLILLAGIALLVGALICDGIASSGGYDFGGRGAMRVCGILVTIAGIYLFPTLKHHRAIVYGLFLFPLLFTFLLTVIIPMCFGIAYSFTDWNGIRLTKVVGFNNYLAMFRRPEFLWSIIVTFLFVLLNVILVNVIGFLLALLCTTKIKGSRLFQGILLPPQPDRRYRPRLCLEVHFQQSPHTDDEYRDVDADLVRNGADRHSRGVYLAVRRLYHADLYHRTYRSACRYS